MTYTQPVKVGDEIQVTIINIGEKGDGVARYEDFVVLVPNTQTDKTYMVRIRKVFPTWALAEIVREE